MSLSKAFNTADYDLTARLDDVTLTDTANVTPVTREFDYALSGQIIQDARAANDNGPVFTYRLNARGRMVSVSEGVGTVLASYTYDADEQRIIKVANDRTIHYHYDLEGRLISETDGTTGEVIRDYIWLGLTPLAVFAAEEPPAANDNPCDPLSPVLDPITGLPIGDPLGDPLSDLCDGGPEPEPAPFGLIYLHADHLGRPVIATDTSGSIVWDGGITTPFGEAVSTAGAFSQSLMFPGQYQDAETEGAGVTLSHNWHRTYDPTLGRYLQADPIGLAGGLNRYAYVGGNPVSYVDPDGQIAFLAAPIIWALARKYVVSAIVASAYEIASQTYKLQKTGCLTTRNFNKKRIIVSGIAGGFGGVFKGPSALKTLGNNKRYRDMSSQVYNRPRSSSNDPKLGSKLGQAGLEALLGLGISEGVKKAFMDPFDPTCTCSVEYY